ncbi:MAG: gliding motility-associated C-terminal domain-containing protein [Saprospiraceae bacterium]|nr:gliding motility-associated C-terminal domain-containing protein [Saprospiraceae bacterium]
MTRFFIPIIVCLMVFTQAAAQVPANVVIENAMFRGETGRMACNDAGTITFGDYIGQSNDTDPDTIFMCLGDSLLIDHNGDFDISGDPNPATPAGVGYAFYECPPTIDGMTLDDIAADMCLVTTPPPPVGPFYIFSDNTTNGDATFFNDGNLQAFFNAGDPIQLFFAPITYDALIFPNVEYEGNPSGPCVSARIDQAFSVVYLNEIVASQQNNSVDGLGCTGSFIVEGGLPEFDNLEIYDISITLEGNPEIIGDINQVANHGDTITFFVPQPGTYNITIEDGKSCGTSFTMDMSGCQDVTLEFPLTNALPGDNICVPFTVSDFTNVASMQFTITFDPSILSFTGVQAFNPELPDLSNASFFNTGSGAVTFTWADLSFQGETLPDGETVFEICFDIIGGLGECSPLAITGDPTAIEIGDNSMPTPLSFGYNLVDGSICVSDNVVFLGLEQDSVSCPGFADGSFTITAAGGLPPYSYTWTQLTGGNMGSGTLVNSGDTETISDLPSGLYEVILEDADNPANQAIDTVEILAGPVLGVILNGISPTCFGDSTGSIQATVTFNGVAQPNPGNDFTFNWNVSNENVDELTDLPSGFYAVTVTDPAGCEATASATLSQPGPIEIAPNNTFITNATCSGSMDGEITVIATGGTSTSGNYTYDWGPILGASTGNQSTVTDLNPGIYCLTVTDDNGCTLEECFTVTPVKLLTINEDITDIRCNGADNGEIFITGTTSGAAASTPYTFTWDNFTTAPTNTATTSEIVDLPPGQYIVTMTDSDPVGCQVIDTFIVNEPEVLTVDLAEPVTNETCAVGNDGQIIVEVNGGTAPYTYTWSDGQMDSIATGLSAGFYTLNVLDINNCQTSITLEVSAPTPPTVTMLDDDNILCADDMDGSLMVTADEGGAPIASYEWSTGDSGQMISGLGAGVYYVTITDEAACFTVDSAFVLAPDPLVIDSINVQDPTCPGSTNGQVITFVSGGTGPYTFIYENTPMNDTIVGGSVYPNLPAGTYTGEVIDANGCGPVPIQAEVVDPPMIELSFSAIDSVSCAEGTCDGSATVAAEYSDGTTGSFTFRWESDEETFDATESTATALCAGIQMVTVTDENQCFAVGEIDVPSPPPFFPVNPSTESVSCNGLSDGVATIDVQGATPPYDYFWIETGENTQTITDLPANTYSVQITDANGCTFLQNNIVVSEPDELMLSIDQANVQNVTCGGEADGALGVTYNFNDDINPVSSTPYTWSDNANITNPTAIDFLDNLEAGNYAITITDINGCRDSVTFEITEPDPLFAIINEPDPIPCFNGTTSISVDTIIGGTATDYLTDYSYYVDISDFTNPPNVPFNNVFAGTHVVTVLDAVGCTFTDTLFIEQPPQIEVVFDPDNIVVELGDSTTQLMPMINISNIDSFIYEPPIYLSSDTVRNPFVFPFDDVNYTLTVIDENGCVGEGQVSVEVDRNRNVYIPNAFSPNGDGFNDEFRIFACQGVREITTVKVYDRWGELVYEGDDFFPNCDSGGTKLWDGRFNGDLMNPGVFVYLIEVEFVDDVVLLYRGDVTLLR